MGILAEAYKQHPVEKKFIAPIDFSSIKDIPESHAWGVDQNPAPNKILNEELPLVIPVIDLNNPNVTDEILEACEKWGMFQIINHGISGKTLEKVEVEAKKLFNLPLEEKMKVLRSPEGAAGYGSPRITPFFSKLMWCEGFTIIGNSLLHHAMQLWPNDYQGFCNVMGEYEAQVKGVAEKLLGFMLKSLNIPKSEMSWVNEEAWNISTALQLNSYPSCPDPTRTMGLAQHTDTFLFTILHQTGSASGLQVYKDGHGWVTVEPIPCALVVNVGDLLHVISNGRFPSVVHRAVVNSEKHRMSMAYFYGPPLDFVVAPYVGYSGCQGPCFQSMTVKEYVDIKYKLLDSALLSIRNK